MTTRKKNEDTPGNKPQPAPAVPDLEAMLKIGGEPVLIDSEENDNPSFMAELIDCP